ncbi:HAD domain-containing protein [Streptosporangium sp. NPDC023615]|uniref:HAD domain-containing protein n=1 Tax=Streptosporangium sp. NPDC023615 TaxID=3154794 RepID=UPI0034470707
MLFLDVDGPLIPFGHPGGYPQDQTTPPLPRGSNPLLARLDRRNGQRLAALPCELIWATTWMADANEVIGPLLGLPELPVVDWPDSTAEGPLHWKTRDLVDRASGRSFVWIDDEITNVDRAWVTANHHGQALLHRVDPRRGLTDTDFDVINDWLERL